MFKKLLKGLMVGGALLALSVPAQAADLDINIYGASAQHKFWLNMAPTFLMDAAGGGCADAVQSSHNKKHGIAMGTNCTVADGDNIYFRYSSRASYAGVINASTGASQEMAGPTGCTWTGPKDDSCDLQTVPVHLGASDVAWDRFDGKTQGWEDGHLSYAGEDVDADGFPYVSEFKDVNGNYTIPQPPAVFDSIVVPFAFIANNTVANFRCVRPEPSSDVAGPVTFAEYDLADHKAYPHWAWECDPTQSDAEGANAQCVGHYKCIDGLCNGGTNDGGECETAGDCPDVDVSATRCEAMPINNINHAMAGQIFSGLVDNWRDFGPYYSDEPIQAMIRHEGSGTHATMRDLMQPYKMIDESTLYDNRDAGFAKNNAIHFTSSTDLTAAVIDFPGAIGYVDANKLLDFKGVADGVSDGSWNNEPKPPFIPVEPWDDADGVVGAHILMYNGVEPTRQKIQNCEYEFWAANKIYYNPTIVTGQLETLRANLEAFANNGANLNTLDPIFSDFWGTQGDMGTCTKTPKVLNKKDVIIQ